MTLFKILVNNLQLLPYEIQVQQALTHHHIEIRPKFAQKMKYKIEIKLIVIRNIWVIGEAHIPLNDYVNKQI